MGHESGLKHAGAVGQRKPLEADVAPAGEDVGQLTDAQILGTLEQNQLTKVKRLARDHTESAIKALAEICKNKKLAPAPRVSAAKALLEIAHGKPGQQFDPRLREPGGGSGDRLRVIILKLADGTQEEIREVDVTPGAAPVHDPVPGQKSSVDGVAILELDR